MLSYVFHCLWYVNGWNRRFVCLILLHIYNYYLLCVGEVEELQGRLKASRYRVTDLEKEVSSLQGTNEGLEKITHELSCECDKLKLENSTISAQLLEKEEEISELHQKLNARMNDYVTLQQELQEKSSQLSLTQLRVQQVCLFHFII